MSDRNVHINTHPHAFTHIPFAAALTCILLSTQCALLPDHESGSDGAGQGVLKHSCYYPRDCAADGSETCVRTTEGNQCRALDTSLATETPVPESIVEILRDPQHNPQPLDQLVSGLPDVEGSATPQAYREVAQALLSQLVGKERQSLLKATQFILNDVPVGNAQSQPYKFESYRQLYASKYAHNKRLKAALAGLFNFMADKPFFTRYSDGSMGLITLRQCLGAVKTHPMDGTPQSGDATIQQCLADVEPLANLMQNAMALGRLPFWSSNYATRLIQERDLVQGVLDRGIMAVAEEDFSRLITLRHRIDAFFASLEVDYVLLVQLLDEALRGLSLVEMPISISPIDPNTPPIGNEDVPIRTYALGQWASGEWWDIEQTSSLTGEAEPIPQELLREYFEGAFRQAIAISLDINQTLEQKLAQGGFTNDETWKLVPLIDATGIMNLPAYASLVPVHEQLRAQIQSEQDIAKREMWTDLGLCGLGFVGGAAVGSLVGATMAGVKVGAALLCSISAYHGLKEAQALAQILSAYHTMAFFGMESGYASLMRIDELTEQYKWSLFFAGIDVVGASFDVTDVGRGVPALIESVSTVGPRMGARLARIWEDNWLRHVLTTGQIPVAPQAREVLPDGTIMVRLAAPGAPPVRLQPRPHDIWHLLDPYRYENFHPLNKAIADLGARYTPDRNPLDHWMTMMDEWTARPEEILGYIQKQLNADPNAPTSHKHLAAYIPKRFPQLDNVHPLLFSGLYNAAHKISVLTPGIWKGNYIDVTGWALSKQILNRYALRLAWNANQGLLPRARRIERTAQFLSQLTFLDKPSVTKGITVDVVLDGVVDDPLQVVPGLRPSFGFDDVTNARLVYEAAQRASNSDDFAMETTLAYIASQDNYQVVPTWLRQNEPERAVAMGRKARELSEQYAEFTPTSALHPWVIEAFKQRSERYGAMAEAMGQ